MEVMLRQATEADVPTLGRIHYSVSRSRGAARILEPCLHQPRSEYPGNRGDGRESGPMGRGASAVPALMSSTPISPSIRTSEPILRYRRLGGGDGVGHPVTELLTGGLVLEQRREQRIGRIAGRLSVGVIGPSTSSRFSASDPPLVQQDNSIQRLAQRCPQTRLHSAASGRRKP